MIALQALKLNQVHINDDELHIGATMTLQAICDHELTPTSLQQAAGFTYSRHIRNQATLGGEIAANQVDNGLVPTLVALKAELKLADEQIITVEDYILSENKELITKIILPEPQMTCTQHRITRNADGLAVLTAAVSLPKDQTHPIMAISGMGVDALRLRDVEALNLEGADLERAVADSVFPIEDLRGSVEYKKYIAGVVIADLLVESQQQEERK
ncbi:molybdopterin-dependent oxidoreductase FAD-binding subunit [Vibrio sp. SS-MA-C1-2]|uniref:molybdopterin-dependent oxidoreductase FAD-binding subunit n=1 Tax=Vibrio sp. SS-MA-C1-2 TaxID=2908646 RepID=UPI001F263F1A|nr:molybdopterin-dependent oxidoreductase FAD-binding subunit [Vibrio sp. SS-MA-C1-2]UJF17691.1 molybdopterin-dependent oxidoreductase FAD-binding subunit [Vibrio sp. SS-MA-C1-2]